MSNPKTNWPEVQLTDVEMEEALESARRRESRKRRGRKGRRVLKNSHAVGVVAERAAHKFYGIPWVDKDQPGGDGGVDFTITTPSGRKYTADVKGNTWDGPVPNMMVASNTDNPMADIFILVIPNLETGLCKMAGWAKKELVESFPILEETANGTVLEIPGRQIPSSVLNPCKRHEEKNDIIQEGYLAGMRESFRNPDAVDVPWGRGNGYMPRDPDFDYERDVLSRFPDAKHDRRWTR